MTYFFSLPLFLFFYFHTKNVIQAILSVVILGFSRAFVDYSSSGIENPLTHLLLVVFCIIFFSDTPHKLKLFSLAFIASLSAFNRLYVVCQKDMLNPLHRIAIR